MERWIGSCRRELLDRTLVWNLAGGQTTVPGLFLLRLATSNGALSIETTP